MSPEAILSALTKLRRDLSARQHPDGYDFSVTHRSAGIVESMKVLRASLKIQGWATLRSKRPPIAMYTIASDTSVRRS